MMQLISGLFSLLMTDLIFTRALGTSTLLAAAKNRSSLPFLALLMTGFSTIACLLTGLLRYIPGLRALGLGSPVLLLVYTAVTSVIYCIALLLLYLLFRQKFAVCKKYVHLSAFNCAVMGTLYLAFTPSENGAVIGSTPLHAAAFGLQEGLGFLIAALMLSALLPKLYSTDVPAAFRGFPAVMICIGLLSMAVYAVI